MDIKKLNSDIEKAQNRIDNINKLKHHSVLLSEISLKWKLPVKKYNVGSGYLDVHNSITASIQLNHHIQRDHHGNKSGETSIVLLPSLITETFVNDPEMFERFLTQYNGHLNNSIRKCEIKHEELTKQLASDIFESAKI